MPGREIGKIVPSQPETAPGGAPPPSAPAASVSATLLDQFAYRYTRLPPSAPAASVSATPASIAAEHPAQRYLASYWSYLKRYRTVVIAGILIGLAALLIRMAYKPPPSLTAVRQPEIQASDNDQGQQLLERSPVKPSAEQPPVAEPPPVLAEPQPEQRQAVQPKAPMPPVPARPQPEKKQAVRPKASAHSVPVKPQSENKKKRSRSGSSSRRGGWKIID